MNPKPTRTASTPRNVLRDAIAELHARTSAPDPALHDDESELVASEASTPEPSSVASDPAPDRVLKAVPALAEAPAAEDSPVPPQATRIPRIAKRTSENTASAEEAEEPHASA